MLNATNRINVDVYVVWRIKLKVTMKIINILFF